MGRPLINPDDVSNERLVIALRTGAKMILSLDGDRDHMNTSGVLVEDSMKIHDVLLCAASKIEAK